MLWYDDINKGQSCGLSMVKYFAYQVAEFQFCYTFDSTQPNSRPLHLADHLLGTFGAKRMECPICN